MLGELSQCSPEGLCALYIWFNNSHYLVFQPWPCTLPTAAQALLIILCFSGFICFHKFLCMARIFLLVLKFTVIYLQSTELLLVSYLAEGFYFFPCGRMWWEIQWTWFVSSFKPPVVHGSNWQPQNYPSCCSKSGKLFSRGDCGRGGITSLLVGEGISNSLVEILSLFWTGQQSHPHAERVSLTGYSMCPGWKKSLFFPVFSSPECSIMFW